MRLLPALLLTLLAATSCGDDSSSDDNGDAQEADTVNFAVTFTNVTAPGALTPDGADAVDLTFAPGVWVVHTDAVRLFTAGTPATGTPIEALAEEGRNQPMLDALDALGDAGIIKAAPFATLSMDNYAEDPIAPGESVTMGFSAPVGARLSMASMFIQSNDIFIGSPDGGIPLFTEAGEPAVGDASASMRLWDAGTEVNQEPGVGPDQAPRQSEAGQGPPEDGVITVIDGADAAGFTYPAPTDLVQVTIAVR